MTFEPEKACALIWRLWQAGEVVPELPAGLRPTTRAEGYRAQAFLERCSSQPLFGWKIAWAPWNRHTSLAARPRWDGCLTDTAFHFSTRNLF